MAITPHIPPTPPRKKPLSPAEIEAFVRSLIGHISVDYGEIEGLKGPHIIFTGANVHIRDGSGFTASTSHNPTGLGNLVIGYNEPRVLLEETGNRTDKNDYGDRGGSHNLIVGPLHKYPSFGGFVAGSRNKISGLCASVSGGNDNTASGGYSGVSGGWNNTASGTDSSVSGGANNTAIGPCASVSGGQYNNASKAFSSVCGGEGITEGNQNGWAAGGYHTP